MNYLLAYCLAALFVVTLNYFALRKKHIKLTLATAYMIDLCVENGIITPNHAAKTLEVTNGRHNEK